MNMDLNITSDCPRIDFACITSQDDAPSGDIAFAAGTSVLGAVLAARSAHGICAVLIGLEAEELTADLAERFPKNTIVRDDRKLEGDIEKILRFIETPARGLDLELDVHGTPFQRRGWGALCGNPAPRPPTHAPPPCRPRGPGGAPPPAHTPSPPPPL